MTQPRIGHLVLGLAVISCVGSMDDPEGSGPSGEGAGNHTGSGGPGGAGAFIPGDPSQSVMKNGIRRLTRSELQNTILDLVGADPGEFMYAWPLDSRPFDTNYLAQTPSMPLTQAMKAVADGIAGRITGDAALRQKVVGCAPASAADTTCIRGFISNFGRRALRRPLDADEVDELQALATKNGTSFNDGVGIVIRDLFQDPEFLYLVECGGCTMGRTPPPPDNLPFKLNGWEMASRLSYLLWGRPDPALYALAARSALETPEAVTKEAARMLADKRAWARVDRFHAMWFHYEWNQATLALPKSMMAESNALFERVIFTRRAPWTDVLRSTSTFVDSTLAQFYNDHLGAPASGSSWVSYGASGRRGFLSHATYLSADSGPSDTSPTRRGKNLRNLLLCEDIPPPDASLKIDNSKPPPIEAGACKIDRYANSYLRPGSLCAGCHNQMDATGFGLENYDRQGRYRSTDDGKSSCPITGQGKLMVGGELKDFTRPSGLANLLVETPETQDKIRRCLVKQFFRFAAGRPEQADYDQKHLDALLDAFQKSNDNFLELMTAFVSSPGFGYRLPDAIQN